MQNTNNQIFFNFSYFALNLLGKNLYSTPLSAISELVANGLDAQASNIKLYINMEDKEHSIIEILDNGTGMTYSDLANKYVFMGKNKRDELPEELKQTVMGRKGIGKLSALFLSKKYYIITKTQNEGEAAWCLDTLNSNESETPSLQRFNLDDISFRTKNYFKNFKSGTIILLPNVNLVGIGTQSIEGLKANLSDYFLTNSIDCKIEVCVVNNKTETLNFETVQKSIAYKNMCAFIDNTKEDYAKNLANYVRYTKSKYDKVKNKKREIVKINPNEFPELSGEHEFTLEDGHTKINIPYKVEGWIGIHSSIEQSYATDNDERFIRNKVYTPAKLRLYIRKKLAVENFMELMGRTQAFDNYIEGEISFDILDDDRLEDIATTNRQNLKPDDERVQFLIKILNPVIGRLVRERVKFGNQITDEEDAIEAEIKKKQEEEKLKAEEKAERERKAKEEAERKQKEEEERRKKAEEKAKQEEAARKAAEEKAKNAQKTIEQINSENIFLRKTNNVDIDVLTTIFHSVLNYSDTINEVIESYNPPTLDNINELTDGVKESNKKINIISKMATLKNFSDKTEPINGDLTIFLKLYIKELCSYKSNKNIKIIDNLNMHDKFNKEFIPIEIILMIDNIISNSKKARAKTLTFSSYRKDDFLVINIQDDGIGLNSDADEISIFEKGKSYTNGSGLGLYQIKNAIEKIKGIVKYKKSQRGFCLEVILKCN